MSFGVPVIILKEGSEEVREKEARIQNINAMMSNIRIKTAIAPSESLFPLSQSDELEQFVLEQLEPDEEPPPLERVFTLPFRTPPLLVRVR